MSDSNDRPTFADMIRAQSSGNTGSGRRRLSMAEMLRQSPLTGNTVALPDAVESAQIAKARKEEALEMTTESPAPAQIPEATPPSEQITPIAFTIPTPTPAPVPSPNRYNLYARMQGRWTWQCDIHATNHADGMRQAIAWLKPEHDALPIRLEQDERSAAA